jgi:tetratricopeptide (TPR) repeat protein
MKKSDWWLSVSLGVLVLVAGSAVAQTKTSSDGVDGLAQRAGILMARRSWDEAIAAYRQAVSLAPSDATLYNRLGIACQRAGDLPCAAASYEKATRLDPKYAEAWNNRGALEHTKGRHKKAIQDYEKAIELKPGVAVFHRNLGAAWLARGDDARAISCWAQALTLDPGSLGTTNGGVSGTGLDPNRQYFLMAKLLVQKGDVDRTLTLLTEARANGFRDFTRIARDPAFASVVADPRWAAVAN